MKHILSKLSLEAAFSLCCSFVCFLVYFFLLSIPTPTFIPFELTLTTASLAPLDPSRLSYN